MASNAKKTSWPMSIALLIATIALSYVCAKLTWTLIERYGLPSIGYETLSETPVEKSNLTSDEAKQITEQHLFGTAPQKPAAQIRSSQESARKSNVFLYGIRYSTTPESSRALLSVDEKNAGKSKSYAEGEKISNSVQLLEIYPKYVVVQNGIEREEIYLGLENKENDVPGTILASGDSDQDQLFETIAEQYGLSYDGEGVIINETKNPIIQAMGLRPGDSVVSFNGESVSDLLNTPNVMERAAELRGATLTIKRGGRTVDLDFNW